MTEFSASLAPQVEAFLRYLSIERQLSPLTVTSYRRQLSALMEIGEQMGLAHWQTLDAAQVRSLVSRSKRAGLHASSLALRLSALRSFSTGWSARACCQPTPLKGSVRHARAATCQKY